ncbi:MAG: hypothetical protein RLZZ299_2239 [Pseudomonadota bacterium]
MSPLQALRTARNIARAVRRGEVFPPAGRVPARDAPGGSTRTLHRSAPGSLGCVEHVHHRVGVPGLAAPLRILHVTDVHLRADVAWAERTAGWVRTAWEALPHDVLVLTGDVVTRGWSEEAVTTFLGGLPAARLGRFAVMGNWEHWGGAPPATWGPRCAAHGITLLRDAGCGLGPVWAVGTEDALAGPADPARAFADADLARPVLVLTHSPGILPTLVPHAGLHPGAVVLAGHTHGGQVRLPGVGPFFLPRGSGAYPWGWYERDGVHLFVGRGLGWSIAPVRWRAPPELATIELLPG